MIMANQSALNTIDLHWQAGLEINLQEDNGITRLGRTRHYGPLRLQRPFWPEGRDLAHLYVLHPPGGLVAGDELRQLVTVGAGAHGLVTTPGAGKVYFNHSGHRQQQVIEINVDDQACLEWLPQETILYDGGKGSLKTDIRLSGSGQYIGWDIVCLGRQASGESFTQGHLLQTLNIYRDQCPIFCERLDFSADSLRQHCLPGLYGKSVFGTLLATVEHEPPIEEWHQQLAAGKELSLSWRAGVFIVRYLGNSSRRARALFEQVWMLCRPLVNGRQACRPRIWNT